ncbi:hypothetical protein B9Z65_6446 [Elsinoe australis]|uniref:Uncharacterized protein n=1 Tax=Elsinoe australis TaxID=40998 RepID=A0A2P8A8N9_9PEZI|nr:hypothetical protein B9Z65_6446 [Elsinoe australis]
MAPPRKRLKRGSYVHRTVAKLAIAPSEEDGEAVSASTKSNVCENAISYQLNNGGQSMTLSDSEGQYGAVFVGSKAPFTLQKTVIESGPLKGRLAFVVDPIPDPENIFPLLQLPPELRQMIFREVLVSKHLIHIAGACFAKHGLWLCSGNPGLNSALLTVNKQIQEEATSMLYSLNAFCFHDTRVAVKFIKHIGTSAQFLRRIGIEGRWYASHGKELMALLSRMSIREFVLLNPYGFELKAVAKSCKAWFKYRNDTEEEVDRLLSLIYIGRCEYCFDGRRATRLRIKCPFKRIEHLPLKKELGELIDDEIL